MPKATIFDDVCKGCGLCVQACPVKIIELDKHHINNKGYNPARVMDMEKCTGCASCARFCPDCAIEVER